MPTPIYFAAATIAITVLAAGNQNPAAKPAQTGTPVIVITASYPGASASPVADHLADSLEFCLNGTPKMVRMESESGSDGSYCARLYFEPNTDLKEAMKVVEKRAALPALPAEVRKIGVSVKIDIPKENKYKVSIALIDSNSQGWGELKKWSDVVAKTISKKTIVKNLEAFPVEGKQFSIVVDTAKCAKLGIGLLNVADAIHAAGHANLNIETAKKITLVAENKQKAKLEDVATFEEFVGPVVIYRINLNQAIRISADPLEGATAADATASCMKIIEALRKETKREGFVTENLSGK